MCLHYLALRSYHDILLECWGLDEAYPSSTAGACKDTETLSVAVGAVGRCGSSRWLTDPQELREVWGFDCACSRCKEDIVAMDGVFGCVWMCLVLQFRCHDDSHDRTGSSSFLPSSCRGCWLVAGPMVSEISIPIWDLGILHCQLKLPGADLKLELVMKLIVHPTLLDPTHAHAHAHAHTYIHTYIPTCLPTYLHACIHTYIDRYMHTHTHIHSFIRSFVHSFILSFIHSFIHTYIHRIYSYMHM